MTEQKRRGRPPKANPEDLSGLVREVTAAMPRLSMDDPAVASVVAELTGDKTSAAQAYAAERLDVESDIGTWDRPPIAELDAMVGAISPTPTPFNRLPNAAQAYADRVWAGQSISALRSWRIERVKAALEGQGLPFDGVELPE